MDKLYKITACRFLLSLFLVVLMHIGQCYAQQGAVQKVEPPNWWVGMKNTTLQIILYGPSISEYAVSIDYPGVRFNGATQVENPNYLFVNVDIQKDAKAGKLPIKLSKGKRSLVYEYPLLEREGFEGRILGLDASDYIYLIMPDRFANGDPANDIIKGMQQTTIDRSDDYQRHGGDLKGITDRLDYIADLGVTAIWLNPVQENDQPSESYHGYAITDLYNVDRRFGGNEAYLDFIAKARSKGIKTVMDVIHNHVGDRHWIIQDLPFKDFVHQHDEFTRTTYRASTQFDPYASEADHTVFTNGWFDHHMPDLNQSHPMVATWLTQNNIWWIEYAGIDAFRLDTYAYSDKGFLESWGKAIMDEYPQFGMFGETWVHGVPTQAYFHGNTNINKDFDGSLPGLTDFQLYYAINEAMNGNFGWTDGVMRIYYTLAHDYVYKEPSKNVIFLDNHDLSRVYSVAGEDMNKFKMAIGWLMTTRGIPNLYYGTEILMKNFDDHKGGGNLREDFPGGWSGDQVNKFTKEGRTGLENAAFEYVRGLGQWRKNKKVIHSGKLMQFIPDDNVYVYFRYDDENCVMVIMNCKDQEVNLDTKRFTERMKSFSSARVIPSGETLKDISSIKLDRKTTLILDLTK